LSHNRLSCSIPFDFLRVASLDLSYNQLTGEYEDTSQNVENSTIILEINRLSGQLPVAGLESVSKGEIHVLRGNIFSCHTIPGTDEYSRDYVCGSRNLNDSLFVIVSAFGVAALVLIVVCWGRATMLMKTMEEPRLVSALRSWGILMWTYMSFVENLDRGHFSNTFSPALRKVTTLSGSFVEVVRCAIQLLSVVLVGSMVLYVVKWLDASDAYSTHSNTYSWFWTVAYMRGVVPAGLLLMMWTSVIIACFLRIVVLPARGRSVDSSDRMAGAPTSEKEENGTVSSTEAYSFVKRIPVVGAFVFNTCVTVTVNALYIYSTQQALGASAHFVCQLSLSIFRLIYSAVAFPVLSRSIGDAVRNVRFRFLLLMINNLLLPCVVTALTSDSCFQGLLIPADAVRTPYTYRSCLGHTTNHDTDETLCALYGTVEVESASMIPPFTYNNQCGSVLLSAYIPVLLLGYAIQIVLPLVVLGTLVTLRYESVPLTCRLMLHGLIWPEHWLQGGDGYTHNRIVMDSRPDVMLQIRSILCNDVLNNWLLMVTFGLCSPVLAVAVACAVVLKMCLWVLLVGRFTRHVLYHSDNATGDKVDMEDGVPISVSLSTTANESARPRVSEAVITRTTRSSTTVSTRHTNDVTYFALDSLAGVVIPLFKVLVVSFWGLVWCSALFVSLLGWDMAADEVGWLQSLWIPLFPFGCVMGLRCVAYIFYPHGVNMKHDSCELTQVTLHHEEGESAAGVSRSPLHVDSGSRL